LWLVAVFSVLVRRNRQASALPAKTDAKLLQRRAPHDRLRQALGEFIESVVHAFLSYSILFWFD